MTTISIRQDTVLIVSTLCDTTLGTPSMIGLMEITLLIVSSYFAISRPACGTDPDDDSVAYGSTDYYR